MRYTPKPLAIAATAIKTYDIYNTHFIVDLDKKNVLIKYSPTDYKMQNSKKEIEKLKKLRDYVRQTDTKGSVFLKGFCKSLTEKLQGLAKIIPQVNIHSLKSSKDISFFNQDNKTQNKSKPIGLQVFIFFEKICKNVERKQRCRSFFRV